MVALAFFVRYQYFALTGGENYLAWSDANYLGGIVRAYIAFNEMIRHGQPYPGAAYPPGYPLILAALSQLGGGSANSLRLLQSGLDSLTVIPIFYVGLSLSGSVVFGLAASAVYAISFMFAFGAVTLLAEGISPLLIASMLALMVWARDGGTLRWTCLGACAGFFTLVRPDLALLPVLLVPWWFFTTRKVASAAAMLSAFALPLLTWGVYTYITDGFFTLTSQAGPYALWSGLGELTNSYGYFVDDRLAGEFIQSRCPSCLTHGGFFSPDVQKIWMAKYLEAWKEHPAYVLRVLAHRLWEIPFKFPEYGALTQTPFGGYFEKLGLIVLACAVPVLLLCRRYATAFLISMPLLYAEMSIGLVHYEPRYTRYAALSYILAPAVLVLLSPKQWRPAIATVLAALVTHAAYAEIPGLVEAKRTVKLQKAIAAAVRAGHAEKIADLSTIKWTKVANDSEFLSGSRLSMTTDDSTTGYQLFAAPKLPSGRIAIRYRAKVDDGEIGVGILSPDNSRWLAMKYVSGPQFGEGEIDAILKNGGTLYIVNARNTKGRSRFTIEDLQVLRPDIE
jgi:hypothetical protein